MEILYEDDRLWLCVKPVGLSSEENGERPSVPLYLKQQGAVYVGTVHRLDVVTGGVMVFVWKFMVRPIGGAWNVYELLPAFIVASAAVIIVSLATPKPDAEIEKVFEEVQCGE